MLHLYRLQFRLGLTEMSCITFRSFHSNKTNVTRMDSDETCTYCGRGLVNGRCFRRPVNGAEPRRGASEYLPRWGRVSRWVRGRAGWRCELCGIKNGPAPNVLTVHHLDCNKWNLLPWNLAALCQSCHFKVQWTVDFCQSTLSGIYPRWLREHVIAYNVWA